jgi:hypothetical protein
MKIQLVVWTDSDGNPVVQIGDHPGAVRSIRQAADQEKMKGTKVKVVPLGELASEPDAKGVEFMLRAAAVFDEPDGKGHWFFNIETLLCLGARLGAKHQGR